MENTENNIINKNLDEKQYFFIIHYKNGDLKVIKLPYKNTNETVYFHTIYECLFNEDVKSYEYILGEDYKREDDTIMRKVCLNWLKD